MADTPDTPKPDTAAKPVRRRAPRTTAAKPATAKTTKAAAKPAAASTTTPAAPSTAAKPAAKTPKPRSTKRATPVPSAKPASKRTKSDPSVAKTSGKGWGVAAALAGGVAAIGAATAAVLSLRSSSAKDDSETTGKGAHQADGEDSSTSFKAGIADEGSIPN